MYKFIENIEYFTSFELNMKKNGVCFVLFSTCLFANIKICFPKNGDGDVDQSEYFINYEKNALEKLGITALPGSTVDWKEAFGKLAPIAINSAHLVKITEEKAQKLVKVIEEKEKLVKITEEKAQKLVKVIEENAQYYEEKAQYYKELAQKNLIDAGRYHFILLSRNKFVYDEDHYCIGLPEDNNEFCRRIKEDKRFQHIPNEKISCKKHAKKWLWMLVKGDPEVFNHLDKIRIGLNHNANQFLWFADQIQGMFDVFNDDIHSPPASLLDPKPIDLQNMGTYVDFLNTQLQQVMKVYYESDGHVVIIEKPKIRPQEPQEIESNRHVTIQKPKIKP